MTEAKPEQTSILFVFSKAPYGDERAREGLDAALAFAAFDFKVSLLFIEDGIWQLCPQQQAADEQHKNHFKTLSACPLYDINHQYICHPDTRLIEKLLAQNPLHCEVIDSSRVSSLIADHEQVMVY